jgi:hypothetical protein
MAATNGTPVPLSNSISENVTPINVTADTLRLSITFIMASIFLLILVQYYPKYIIGLVLLVIFSVFLYDYQQISSLLDGLGSGIASTAIGLPTKVS